MTTALKKAEKSLHESYKVTIFEWMKLECKKNVGQILYIKHGISHHDGT